MRHVRKRKYRCTPQKLDTKFAKYQYNCIHLHLMPYLKSISVQSMRSKYFHKMQILISPSSSCSHQQQHLLDCLQLQNNLHINFPYSHILGDNHKLLRFISICIQVNNHIPEKQQNLYCKISSHIRNKYHLPKKNFGLHRKYS